MEAKSNSPYRIGVIIFIILMALTLIEYLVGLYFPSAVLLILLAIAKAGLILQFFMHIYRVWREEEHH